MANLSTFLVPQSSVLGPVLFKENPFLTRFGAIPLSLSFVDNAQIQDSTLPQNMQCSISISSQETCVSDIQTWMLENKLKLRMTKQRLSSSFKSFPLIPVSKPTTTSGCGREFSLSSWIFCQKSWFYITDDMSVELYTSCTSRLDYWNLLLSGCPKHLEKVQKVQNPAARLMLKTPH